MFIELNMMITFLFLFSGDLNNRLKERYRDDILTHPEFDPDLWMEVGSSGGPDKNRVYGLSNITVDNLRTARSVSTVGSSQSISSFQSKEFVVLQQCTTQLTERYDHLSAEYAQLKASHAQQRAESAQQKTAYEQLREVVMNMATQSVEHMRLILFGRITTSLLLQDLLLLLLLQLHHYINL